MCVVHKVLKVQFILSQIRCTFFFEDNPSGDMTKAEQQKKINQRERKSSFYDSTDNNLIIKYSHMHVTSCRVCHKKFIFHDLKKIIIHLRELYF